MDLERDKCESENSVPSKFVRERGSVEFLMHRLGISVSEYLNPNTNGESGVDVVAVLAGSRIGIQVTELDIGDEPGRSRREEKKLQCQAINTNGVYGTWGQNDPTKVLAAIQRSISRKSQINAAAGCDEVWLLISCGIPGSLGSTLVMTPWLAVEALDHVTGPLLAASQYKRAFIQVILGIEHALYEWSAKQNRWEKKVERKPSEFQGSSFFEVIKDPEWLTDPDGMADRKVAKVRGEMRKAKNKS